MSQMSSPEVERDVSKLPTADAIHVDLKSKVSPYRPLFGKLPSELRFLIWSQVLVPGKPIKDAHNLMSPQEPLMVASFPSYKDIDSTLLRTCRAIYEETFPILYGNNHFVFDDPSKITTFAFGKLHFTSGRNLSGDTFGLRLKQNGRLTMIRFMTLVLRIPIPLSSTEGHYPTRVLEAAWSVWVDFFQPSPEQHSFGFPALEKLNLMFLNWGLGGSEMSKLRFEPFLRRLRPSDGLLCFWIEGIKHKQNLNDFKHGFVKEGGLFKASISRDTTIALESVSNSNLDTVSKGVREILQRARESALG